MNKFGCVVTIMRVKYCSLMIIQFIFLIILLCLVYKKRSNHAELLYRTVLQLMQLMDLVFLFH